MDFFDFSPGENLIQDSHFQYQEGSSDETNLKKGNPIKKTIKKYEPIVDNSVVYRYEDNPEEYKRMRKKQQNRESATRVRYRQRTHADQMEIELNEMKQLNSQLQLTNAKLQAENAVLKQQLSFFQNLMQQNISIENNSQNTQSPLSPFELERNPNTKRHFAFLTIMTTMLCLVFINQEEFGGTTSDGIAMALQLNSTQIPPNTYNEGSKLGDGSIKYETIKMTCKYSLGIVYVIYLCYVLSTVSTAKNFYRIYRQKTKIL